MHTAIIGGGAAGFFLAINLKEMMPDMEVSIFEKSARILTKVEISGGGRCNCTNSFEDVKDLSAVYPRGHRLLKRLFKIFDYKAAYQWFEKHGVKLVTQPDHCVFPEAQDSHAIIKMFMNEAHRYQIKINLGQVITGLEAGDGGRIRLKLRNRTNENKEEITTQFDYVAVTTGGSPKAEGLKWLARLGHEITPPVPSLFTFNIDSPSLCELSGTVAPNATAFLPGFKYRSQGPLLITHWGVSGPAILKLSSHAARLLSDNNYRNPLCINWTSRKEYDVLTEISSMTRDCSNKQLKNMKPFHDQHAISAQLWNYLLTKTLGERAHLRWGNLNKKDLNRLTNTLCNDTYQITGRGTHKDEFVTCGGISLNSVNATTMESRFLPHLYFAGEVLDIDGITGGFNFQAAWTTSYIVATAITKQKAQHL